MSKAGTKCPKAPDGSAYARGYGAAGRHLGWRDPQGRKFKAWAAQRSIKFAVIGGSPVFRLADLDKAWRESAAQSIPVS